MNEHNHNHENNHEHNHNNGTFYCTKCKSVECNCDEHNDNNDKKLTSGCTSSFCLNEMSENDSDEPPRHNHKKYNNGIINKALVTLGLSSSNLNSKHHGHHGHDGHDHGAFETKKWILIAATILGSIAMFTMIVSLFYDGTFMKILENGILQFVLGTIAFIIMGLAFIKGTYVELKKKMISEDMLVALATTSAYIYSVSALIINLATSMQLPYFFNEEIEVLWLIYLGRFIEEWLTNKVTREINSLESLKPKLATVIRDGNEIEVLAKEIIVGDVVIVRPGQIVPVDGMVVEGETTINESSLTGESLPIRKEIGSTVFGGTISASGLIKVNVTKTLDESFISQIIKSINDAMKTKPKSQRMADKIAKWLIPTVITLAALSFVITGLVFSLGIATPGSFQTLAGGDYPWLYAYYITITVLVIACPCSFAMTTPMSVLASSSTSKKEGVIFSSDSLFETIKSVDVICFDKTGTLTEGKFEVVETTIDDKLLQELISIEKTSTHPLAQSILKHYSYITPKEIKVNEVIGRGVKSESMMVGSLRWLIEHFNDYVESIELIEKRKQGSAIIYAFNDKEIFGYIELRDKIKDTTLNTLSLIRKMNIEVVMITGDQRDTALNIASKLGIHSNNVYSEVSPQQKSEIIAELQSKGKVVSFVGDGINDSVALIQSDIGIAMGEGSDAAIESADIVLRENDLSHVAYSIWLSRRTLYTIKRGFGVAIVYNALMVPLAATGVLGLTGAGPAIAALSMIFNDTIAMVNAMTLKTETKKKFDKKYKKKK